MSVPPTGPPPSRLLVVSDTLAGGLGAVARRHVAWFAARGWSVALAAPNDGEGPDPSGGARSYTIPTPATARHVALVRRASRALSAVVRVEHPDVVHVHGLRSLAVAVAAGIRRPFVTLHGSGPMPSDPPLYHALRRAGLSLVPLLAAEATTVEPGYGPRWSYLPVASPLLGHLDRIPFPAAGTPVFGWIGSLDERKQPELFVHAIARLHRADRPVRGLLAGSGPRAGEIAGMVRATGAPVELLGQVDPVPVLGQCWALALFSRAEGTPLAVEEAMWAGRAVVGSPLPGIEHLIGAGGRLVGTVEAAVAAFEELCDHQIAARAGGEAATRIRAVLDPDSPWPKVERAYAANPAR